MRGAGAGRRRELEEGHRRRALGRRRGGSPTPRAARVGRAPWAEGCPACCWPRREGCGGFSASPYKASGAYTALRGGGGIPVRPGAALGAPEGLGVPPVPCQRCPPRPAPAVSVSVKPRWAGASSRRELLGRGCRHPGRAGGARPQRGRRSRGCKVRLSSAAAALSWSSFRELAAVPCDISKAT